MFAIMRVFHNLLRKGILSQTLLTFLLLLDFNPTKQNKIKPAYFLKKQLNIVIHIPLPFPNTRFYFIFAWKSALGTPKRQTIDSNLFVDIFSSQTYTFLFVHCIIYQYLYLFITNKLMPEVQINLCLVPRARLAQLSPSRLSGSPTRA